ncbi:C-type mannose receptor 2-like [Chanos chanos]|uniref:C-type mannose receptor 2-like n=1 Tax=Chanos chanos TaxID=29144 RepID=A0A6J2VTI7_CHACN|nr:C-type mannose receptor 2-like [Chanos chanos]
MLFLTGLFILCARVPRQYHFVNELKNWTEAQTYCREHYTDLATINNKEDIDELIKSVDINNDDIQLQQGHVWIGLQRGDSEKWLWSLEETKFFRNGEMEFENWVERSPDTKGQNEDCVEMTHHGDWNAQDCEKTSAFMCYDERKVSSDRYILINQAKTWTEAQSYCREHHTDLVSVRNQTENNMTKNEMMGHNPVWIGLFRRSWVWSDQSGSVFKNWAETQPDNNPNEDCGIIWVTGEESYERRMGDWYCNTTDKFVCHENQLILISESLTWSEALNYCREHHVDLVSVHSEKIQKWVMKRVEKASTAHVWLGLRYSCTLGFWFWVSGESSCYQNWAPGNGTVVEECVNEGRTGAVETRGVKQWISLPENTRLNFICSNYEED